MSAVCYMNLPVKPCQGPVVYDLEIWNDSHSPIIVKICKSHAAKLAAETIRNLANRSQG